VPADDGVVHPLPSGDIYKDMIMDRTSLRDRTVYFDFDRSVVKSSEHAKVNAVAELLQERPETSLLIEGHCDERGTEEYNFALGGRRAEAIREYLINSGIASPRLWTESYGEDQPANTAHNEVAWAENRRGEFVLLLPKPRE
jgi:peptidoglycan-associated lipoprotein